MDKIKTIREAAKRILKFKNIDGLKPFMEAEFLVRFPAETYFFIKAKPVWIAQLEICPVSYPGVFEFDSKLSKIQDMKN